MGKKILLFVSLVLTAFAFNANASIKITVKKAGFDPVYLYAWDNEDKAITAAWPGTKMSANADGTYSLTLDVSSMNLLFHNGSGTQTSDIKGITEDACFNVNADATYKRIDCTTGEDWVAPTPAKVKVNFIVPLDWKTVNVFGWDGASFGDWPGTAQTPADGIVTVEVPVGSSIIFNNGTDQTVDIKVTAAICYALGAKTDGKYAVVEDKECKGAVPVKVTYTVVGNNEAIFGKAWEPTLEANDMLPMEQTVEGQKVTYYVLLKENVELKAGTVEWKVAKNHSWDVTYGDGNANKKLTIEKDGKYNIAFTFVEFMGMTQIEATAELVEASATTYYVAGNKELTGLQDDWVVNGKALVSNGIILQDVPAGTHQFKITDGTWVNTYGFDQLDKECTTATVTRGEGNNDNNIIFTTDKVQNIIISINPETKKVCLVAQTAAAPAKVYTVVGDHAFVGAFWNYDEKQNDMTLVEGVYTLVKEKVVLMAGTYEYKVVEGRDWGKAYPSQNAKLEIKEDGEYTITFTYKEGETAPAAEAKKTGDAAKKYYIGGSMNGWDPAGQELIEGKAVLSLAAGDYEFKITNGTWGKEWNYQNFDKECSTLTITDVNGNLKFTLAEAQDVTIEFDAQAEKICVKGKGGDTPIVDNNTYYIVGELVPWGWDDAGTADEVAMTKIADNVYEYVVESFTAEAKKYQYKLRANKTWTDTYQLPAEGNAEYEFTEAGNYKLVFTADIAQHTLTLVATKLGGDTPQPAKVYTVVGDHAFVGAFWNYDEKQNDMTLVEGVYTLVKEKVVLMAGTYEYKVVECRDWGKAYPSQNAKLEIKEDGEYTITFTYKEGETAPAAEAKKTGDAAKKYYIGGSMNGWDPAGQELIEGKAVLSLAAGDYEFKITNGTWGKEWNFQNFDKECSTLTITNVNGNLKFTLAEAQDVTIEFDAQAEKICVKGKGGDTPIVDNNTYYIVGELVPWGWDDAGTADEVAMTKIADNVYEYVVESFTAEAKKYQYKLRANKTWTDTYQLPADGNAEYEFTEAGNYKLVFTADVAQHTLTLVATKLGGDTPQPAKVYTVVGEPMLLGISWNYDEKQNDMTLTEGVYTLVKNNVNLPAYTYEYKVVEGRSWDKAYPSENAKLEVKEDGVYKVTFTYKEGDQAPAAVVEKTDGVYVEEYYVAGSMNGWNAMGEKLVEGKAVLSLTAGSYEFKITNGTWGKEWNWQNIDKECSTLAVELVGGNNIKFTLAEAQDVTIEFDAQTQKICVKGKGGDTPIVDNNTYYIVGELVPWGWDDAGTADEVAMTKIADNVYEYVVESFTAEAKKYQYKLRANKTWTDTYQLPADGNAEYEFTEAGNYKLVFTADVAQHTLTLVATKLGGDTPQPAKVYTVVGEPMLLGINWNYDEKQNDMTLTEGVYTLVKNNVNLPAYTYEYKVVEGRDWGKAYPSQNAKLEIKEDGVYKVTFTYKEGDQAPAALAEKTDGVYVEEYYVAGSMNGWNAMGEKLVEGKVVLSLTAGDYEFKITNGTWGKEWNWQNIDKECSTLAVELVGGNNIKFTLAEAQDVTIEFDAQTQKICVKGKGGDTPQPEKVYSVVGEAAILNTTTDWDVASDLNDMTLLAGIYTLVVEKDVAAGTYEYKVAVNHAWDESYPAQGNVSLTIEETAKYRIVYTYVVGDAAPSAILTKIEGPEPTIEKLYMIGEIEGTNYTWAPNLGVEMTALGGNLFSLTTTIANQQQGEGHFGIVSKLGENADDWATINANRYGPQENDALLVDQVPQGLYAVADNAFKVANGRYTITVDMTQMNIIAVADFTAVDNLSNGVNITVNGSELSLTFNGEQTISVYSVTGQQMTIAVAQDEWHTQLTTGMYVVMVGNEPFKVIVR